MMEKIASFKSLNTCIWMRLHVFQVVIACSQKEINFGYSKMIQCATHNVEFLSRKVDLLKRSI